MMIRININRTLLMGILISPALGNNPSPLGDEGDLQARYCRSVNPLSLDDNYHPGDREGHHPRGGYVLPQEEMRIP